MYKEPRIPPPIPPQESGSWVSAGEMGQDPMVLAQLHVLDLPFVCGKTSKKKSYQRSENMQKQRKTAKRRANNNSFDIKHSQGPVVSFSGNIDNILSHSL